MRRIVLLGAPTSRSLNWDESSLLPQDLPTTSVSRTTLDPEEETLAQWRQVPSDRSLWMTDLHGQSPEVSPLGRDGAAVTTPGQIHVNLTTRGVLTELFRPQEAYSDTSVSPSSSAETDVMLCEFCDESFIADDSFSVSQISDLDNESFEASTLAADVNQERGEARLEYNSKDLYSRTRFSHILLKDLAKVPHSLYLQSIQPQTMTINVVVGIIALPPATTVTAGRRWGRGREVDLVEMLVGDDTKSAFGFSVWLAHAEETDHTTPDTDPLKVSLALLQRGDVILIQNMALCSFRGKVHGQSLRRGATKIGLLHRGRWGDRSSLGLLDRENWAYESPDNKGREKDEDLIEKAKRVGQWMLDFVGEVPCVDEFNSGRVLGPGNTRKGSRLLPPDTQ